MLILYQIPLKHTEPWWCILPVIEKQLPVGVQSIRAKTSPTICILVMIVRILQISREMKLV